MILPETIMTCGPCEAHHLGRHAADSEYSRTFLLPLLGPSALLLWSNMHRATGRARPTTWTTAHLAGSIGLTVPRLGHVMDRAEHFRLIERAPDSNGVACWAVLQVRSLSDAALGRLDLLCPPLRALHRQLHA